MYQLKDIWVLYMPEVTGHSKQRELYRNNNTNNTKLFEGKSKSFLGTEARTSKTRTVD